ncbi:MAG: response regulator transcription factor [Desulfatirhabdiaceae bacterium]|nr:response regulator transcription factor [Desulfatirhabdiaceae bacterium]
MGKTIKVMIAEDHTIVRQGLARLLSDQPGLEVVGQAVNGRDAVEMAEKLNPDIIIMDIAMPKMNGIEASKKIRKLLPKAKILILSMYSHEHYVHELLEVGVSGYLLKDSSGRDIIKAIDDAMKNKTFLSPAISKRVAEINTSSHKNTSREERFKLLSNREREVFQLVAEGHTTRTIAEMLCVSLSTIKSHRAKIMEKLAAKSSVQLVHIALQLGLVDPEL